ncbi:MAG: prolipoprotein diacylglyceryl transferase [Puniceicoccales bacterium]|jgi:phosphatidylglycerol:prolipoprotein diacylglycerol transferase|nr:prolipoprotein diacylglyceryl transferase [Puniceicoccales bacterium]
MDTGHYIHNIDPFAVKFYAGCPIEGIRWYGVFYMATFVFVILALNFYTKMKKSPLSRVQNLSFLDYVIVGVVVGGRVGYMVLYCFGKFIENPLEVFAVWHGGMSSHGGFVGVALAILLFCRKNGIHPLPLTDICSTIAPFGFLLGRIANFINGELFGRVTSVKWGVIFPKSAHFSPNLLPIYPRHPSQLYEGLLEGLVLFLYMQLRFWIGKKQSPGRLSGEFLVLYSVFRMGTECFREPDAALILNMSRGQFYSIYLMTIGLAMLCRCGGANNGTPA